MQRCHGAPSTCASAAFRPGVRVADGELRRRPGRARRATAQELAPERLGLRLADVEADDLAAAGLVHGVRDHDALARDAAAVADLLDLGVDEQIRVAALQRPLAERLDLLIEQPGDPADLALGDPQPEALDELIDPARRDAADIRLLHHADQRLLGALARLQEATGSSCPDGSSGSATRSHPPACPSAAADSRCDASRGPRAALTVLGADQLGHLGLHQLPRDRLAPTRGSRQPCSSRSTCLTTSSIVILSAPAIAGLLSSNREEVRRS